MKTVREQLIKYQIVLEGGDDDGSVVVPYRRTMRIIRRALNVAYGIGRSHGIIDDANNVESDMTQAVSEILNGKKKARKK